MPLSPPQSPLPPEGSQNKGRDAPGARHPHRTLTGLLELSFLLFFLFSSIVTSVHVTSGARDARNGKTQRTCGHTGCGRTFCPGAKRPALVPRKRTVAAGTHSPLRGPFTLGTHPRLLGDPRSLLPPPARGARWGAQSKAGVCLSAVAVGGLGGAATRGGEARGSPCSDVRGSWESRASPQSPQ